VAGEQFSNGFFRAAAVGENANGCFHERPLRERWAGAVDTRSAADTSWDNRNGLYWMDRSRKKGPGSYLP
jgi:hypothetical protein